MDWISEFINYIFCEKRFSIHTRNAYEADLILFQKFISDQFPASSIKEADHKIIRSWIFHLIEEGNSPRTVNRKLSTLKTFYKFLLRNEAIQTNPMVKVVSLKQSKRIPSFVDQTDMASLFEKISFPDTFEGIRDKTIIETFYALGIRQNELINIKYGDIDFFSRNIKVLGKRNKERLVPFGPNLDACLKYYLTIYENNFGKLQQNTFIFVTKKGEKVYPMLIYRLINNYISMVSVVEQKSPHVIRHTFATHLLNQGADINAIKELLGHTSLSATQVYTHTSIEKLKDIYKQAHPRA